MSETARVDEAMDGNVLVLTINYPQRKNAMRACWAASRKPLEALRLVRR